MTKQELSVLDLERSRVNRQPGKLQSDPELPNAFTLDIHKLPIHYLEDRNRPAYTMAKGYSVFVGLAIVAGLCVAAWFLSPKGENQTTWRSSLILAFVSCYLMWFITFMAQLHPLIEPRRSTVREGFQYE
ncbi:ATP synthase subunit H-domain-containing protein [Hypoxylon sp. FL0890]|nr:ATP synthase subunit H-domain-containing protein [Hypoxylon sp. FL0890]